MPQHMILKCLKSNLNNLCGVVINIFDMLQLISNMTNGSDKMKERKSNIELLRIVTMIMIIFHHFAIHGKFNFPPGYISINRMWILFIWIFGKIGVDIFVLISGYLLITSKKVKTTKIIKFYFQLIFYSIGIYLIFSLLKIIPFSKKELIYCFFPITNNLWWFASSYFVLYILSPFINKFAQESTQKTYKNLLLLMAFIWCIIPTLTDKGVQSNSLIWFTFVYLLGGYIKLYKDDLKIKYIYIKILLSILLTVSSSILIAKFQIKIPLINIYPTYFYGMDKLPILLISLLIFIAFKNLDIKTNKIINTIASTTFGIYLIHDNPYIRKFLWQTLFKNAKHVNKLYLIPYSITTCVLVFIVCSMIEYLRIFLIEKRYMAIIYKYENKINNTFSRLMKRVNKAINKAI